MTAPRIVRCPNCGGPSVYAPANAFRPFCSHRCRTADLGAWASGDYRIPAASTPDDDSAGDEQPIQPPTR